MRNPPPTDQPVMRRILDQIPQRHRSFAKVMHKQRLVLPLQKVKTHTSIAKELGKVEIQGALAEDTV